MLPPFIIEQIRQREAEERLRKEANRPRLELPLDAYYRRPAREERPEDASEVPRGVIVLDL
ncbi:MAG: hypothetical protein RJA70_421 [Pseudomonadota bacterium]|jgi:hypothetical protein